ncbi:MAG: CDP-glucose 4,6-dehydratase [Betaproteobacteria bacterium]|nr:CDP-glucose 4,6-dehydratase [Betaproteobacteria bacterium]
MCLESSFWRGKRVLLTGHSGFKGGWLAIWLKHLGASVTGLSLPPQTTPNLFSLARISECLTSHWCDVRDAKALSALVRRVEPEIVLHLAAQPLVRASYADPLGTYATNVMGTAHLLDALRGLDSVRVAVMVTTDKVYRNQETPYPYREDDPLGGHDPYSASKAASEIVISSYRDSYLKHQGVALATARAGNVIGGGDWSTDRLIPDAMRAWSTGTPLVIRRPDAVRPWQHVIEPLAAYMVLAQHLWHEPTLAGAYNFGPSTHTAATVKQVINLALSAYGTGVVSYESDSKQLHEAGWLALETARARVQLGILPQWDLNKTITQTVGWYRAIQEGTDARYVCLQQIQEYSEQAWAAWNILPADLDGLCLIERQRGRFLGFLSRMFCSHELAVAGWAWPVAQINHTLTRQGGTVRGIHFQRQPHAEAKLVSCLRGRVWDVAVDLRKDSPTYLQWRGHELSPDNGLAMLIPPGFAHVFQTLNDDVEMLYLHSTAHAPEAEGIINALDARLEISWPLPVRYRSARDENQAPIGPDFEGISL